MPAISISAKAPNYFSINIIITNLLHDCLEDTTFCYNNIVDIFGKIIASKVNNFTRINKIVKETLEHFIPLAIYLNMKGSKEELITLCKNIFNKC